MTYLCYDIRGVQSFIFAVPRLKYIVGGSSVVDNFDRQTSSEIAKKLGVDLVASGGGRGMFKVENKQKLQSLKNALRENANTEGLDLWLGIGTGFQAADPAAEEYYPWLPETLDGPPCSISGLYPVTNPGDEHQIIRKRRDQPDTLGQYILKETGERLRAIPGYNQLADRSLALPRDVSGDDSESTAAAAAFGPSKRWAIVAMDGNDIGRQHQAAQGWVEQDPDKYASWLGEMSRELDDLTRQSFLDAVVKLIGSWLCLTPENWINAATGNKQFLPLRPLILGGDDLVCLVHPALAFAFASNLSSCFSELSAKKSRNSDFFAKYGEPLWPATNGELSISAGIAYTGHKYPLYSSLRYAESLLSSAKSKFRGCQPKGRPQTAAVDWEHITEGLVDSPDARRRRDLCFQDMDNNGQAIWLTDKPWAFENFSNYYNKVKTELENLPRHLTRGMVSELRSGFGDRFAFRRRVGVNHPKLSEWLDEPDGRAWKNRSDGLHLRLFDVITHMEESRRETAARAETP